MMWVKNFLILIIAITFGSCSQGKNRNLNFKNWVQPSKEIRILCTTAQTGELVSAIGGDRVKVLVLIQGDLDPHSYELVKGDGEKISIADTIFYNGLNLEHGVSLSEQLRENPKAVAVGDAIAKEHPERILKKDSVVDPHLWMDVSTWSLAIDPIYQHLVRVDPQGEAEYHKRAQDLRHRMETAHVRLKAKMDQIPHQKRYLMTSHDAFRYFTRAYLSSSSEDWQDRFAAPEGLAPDGQLSPVDIQRMISFIKICRVAVIFPESNVNRDSIKKIASAGKEMGLNLRVCDETLYGDSMSGLTYFEMMEKNADVLTRHLTQ